MSDITRKEDWTDPATGYQCLAKFLRYTSAAGHWCGYVAVPDSHPLSGKSYHHRIPRPASLDGIPLGGRAASPVVLVLAANKLAEDEKTWPLELAIDVHGCLTFADRWEKGGPWFFGFDCGHYDDTPEICDLDFVRAECTKLAAQLKNLEVAP